MRTLIVFATIVSLFSTFRASYTASHVRDKKNLIVRVNRSPRNRGPPLEVPFHLQPENNPFINIKQLRPSMEKEKPTFQLSGIRVFNEQPPEHFTESGIYSNRETSEVEIYVAPTMGDTWQALIGRQKGTKTTTDPLLDGPPPIVVRADRNTHFVAVSSSHYTERRDMALHDILSEARAWVNDVDVTDKHPIVFVTSEQEIMDLKALVLQALVFQKIHQAEKVVMIPSVQSGSNSKDIKPMVVRMAPVDVIQALGWRLLSHLKSQPKVNIRFNKHNPASGQYPSWRDFTFVYGSDNPSNPDLNKRSNTIATITNQEHKSAATDRNSMDTDDATAQFQSYLSAFQTLQGNISDAIFPILKEIVNNTNSSLVYNVAWSIWSDLTVSSEVVMGPFSNGMHSLDSLEDQYAAANNLSENSPQFQDYLAVNAVLLDLYSYAWNASVQAANVTGALTILSGLAQKLRPNDTAIRSASFANISQADFEDKFFTRYDKTFV